MSILTEIARITEKVADAYDACEDKGATIPQSKTVANLADCIATITGGGSGLPVFTYTGTYAIYDEGNDNWHIVFITSGTLNFSSLGTGASGVQLFLVGGGGGGGGGSGYSTYWGWAGGNGGCRYNSGMFYLQTGVDYSIVIGAGGAQNTNGGSTSGFGYTVDGGLTKAGTPTLPVGVSCSIGGASAYNGAGSNGAAGAYPFGVSGLDGCNYKCGASGAGGSGYSGKGAFYTDATGGADGGGNGGGTSNKSGRSGTVYGAGGGGAAGNSSSYTGGSGHAGVIVLRNYR